MMPGWTRAKMTRDWRVATLNRPSEMSKEELRRLLPSIKRHQVLTKPSPWVEEMRAATAAEFEKPRQTASGKCGRIEGKLDCVIGAMEQVEAAAEFEAVPQTVQDEQAAQPDGHAHAAE